jgi:hypothetical protein
MKDPINLKSAERKAFQTTFEDGLWDVFIGCFALEFAIAPLLSGSLGDFWSSAIFLPFFGLAYLAIWLARKHVVAPRIGKARFGKVRVNRLRRFTIILVGVNVVLFVLGLLAAFAFGGASSGDSTLLGNLLAVLLGLILLAGFSVAAHLLDFPRLYLYGALLFVATPVGEWLYRYHGAAHHGYPIVFGITAAIMIVTGLVLFVRLIRNNPIAEMPEVER